MTSSEREAIERERVVKTFTRHQNGAHNAYTATLAGHDVLIEHASNAIAGGKGWIVWIDGETPSVEHATVSRAQDAALRTVLYNNACALMQRDDDEESETMTTRSVEANGCDGEGPHISGARKRFPLGENANAILCRACFDKENAFRRDNRDTRGTVDWNSAREYTS